MDFDIKAAVQGLETLEKPKLEDFKDRCGRQVLSWALTDPTKLKTHRDEVKLCEQLVNRFGTDFLKDIEKKSG